LVVEPNIVPVPVHNKRIDLHSDQRYFDFDVHLVLFHQRMKLDHLEVGVEDRMMRLVGTVVEAEGRSRFDFDLSTDHYRIVKSVQVGWPSRMLKTVI
jgi:hypothetical protein